MVAFGFDDNYDDDNDDDGDDDDDDDDEDFCRSLLCQCLPSLLRTFQNFN